MRRRCDGFHSAAKTIYSPAVENASGIDQVAIGPAAGVDMCNLELRYRPVLASVLVVALVGCSREQNGRDGDVAGAEDQSIPSLPSSSETSLSLKRGMITFSGETGTFKPCGGDKELWVIDQSDGSYKAVAEIAQANEPLYVEARGERSPVPSEEPAAASAYSAAFVLEQIVYASEPTAGRGCESPATGYIVRARGNEVAVPVWTVEVSEQKMEWMQDKGEAITVESPQEADTEGAVSYEGRNAEHALQLIIDAQPCRDPTTEEFFAYSARVVLDTKEFKGCARVGR
jgi:uncharacterized membrane protein